MCIEVLVAGGRTPTEHGRAARRARPRLSTPSGESILATAPMGH
jgi:hypothetical protein